MIWLIFFQIKLLPWNKYWGTFLSVLGLLLLAVVVGLLNYFTPSGRVTVQGKVVEITPNVAGRVTEIFVEANTPIKKGTPLFQIDPAPMQYEVDRLKAALAEAESRVAGLTTDLKAAEADVRGLKAEVKLARFKRRDIGWLVKQKVKSAIELDKVTTELASIEAQLAAAQARSEKAKLALDSVLDGKHTSVVQIRAQLAAAKWQLAQTKPLAPIEGYVSVLTLATGQRVTPIRSAMALIDTDSIAITGVFGQNGFQRIRPGARVRLAFSSVPGRIFDSSITAIVRGIGEGQVSPSGALPTIPGIGATSEYMVRIAVPENLPPEALALGMSGTATVFAEDASAVALLGQILLWIRAQVLYL